MNTYHDHLRDAPGIGFDASSGNFEGADRVEAQVDDGAATDAGSTTSPTCDHANNAFVIPVPDGDAAGHAALPVVERLLPPDRR